MTTPPGSTPGAAPEPLPEPSPEPVPEPIAGPASEQTPDPVPDPFDDLVLDENFVRGGTFEPPARTRLAIARYGDQGTSWRHGGGLHDPARERRGKGSKRAKRSRAAAPRPASRRDAMPASAAEKLPLIVSIVVVVIAAFLMFR